MASLNTASQNGEWITRILRSTTILLGFFLALSVVDASPAHAACGDAILDPGEECDDGNNVDGDGCDDFIDGFGDCTLTACGNGVITGNTGEVCDDDNARDGTCSSTTTQACAFDADCPGLETCVLDSCASTCQPNPAAPGSTCGNGAVTQGEQCDDGNTLSGDGCRFDCVSDETCGNGETDGPVEDCDDGGESAACNDDCTTALCGDGKLNVSNNEACDDGNNTPGDGCSATCKLEGCGDGFVAPSEQCDDGGTCTGDNTTPCTSDLDCAGPGGTCETRSGSCAAGLNMDLPCTTNAECPGSACVLDGCDDDCFDQTCNNGKVQPWVGLAEQCDDGAVCTGDGTTACITDADCTVAGGTCTGTTGALDGCNDSCVLEFCGNTITEDLSGIGGIPEECDNGQTCTGDGTTVCTEDIDCLGVGGTCQPGDPTCGSNCSTAPICRNGEVEAGEQCDDGGTCSGDGTTACVRTTDCTVSGGPGGTCIPVGGDGCSTSCLVEECGNAITDPGEECDGGGTCSGDQTTGCTSDAGCVANGTCETWDGSCTIGGEACNVDADCGLGDTCGIPNACTQNCTLRTCGNNVVDLLEECDDGGLCTGDGVTPCSSTATCTAVGGPGGTCVSFDNDGCSTACVIEFCGDTVVQTSEECDTGGICTGDGTTACTSDAFCAGGVGGTCEARNGTCSASSAACTFDADCPTGQTCTLDTCDTACLDIICSNGRTDSGETCDDGNLIPGDGCNASCIAEFCGDGIVQPGAGSCFFDSSKSCSPGPGPWPNCAGTSPLGTSGVCASTLSLGLAGIVTCEQDSDCPIPVGDCLACSGEFCDDGGESVTCDSNCLPSACGNTGVNATSACTTALPTTTGSCTTECFGTGSLSVPGSPQPSVYCTTDAECAPLGTGCGPLYCVDDYAAGSGATCLVPGLAPHPGCTVGAFGGLCAPAGTAQDLLDDFTQNLSVAPVACDDTLTPAWCGLPPGLFGAFGGAVCLGGSCTSDAGCPVGETCGESLFPTIPFPGIDELIPGGTAAMLSLNLYAEQCDDGNTLGRLAQIGEGAEPLASILGSPVFGISGAGVFSGLLPGQGYCDDTEAPTPQSGACFSSLLPGTPGAACNDNADLGGDAGCGLGETCHVLCATDADCVAAGAGAETCILPDDGDGCSSVCALEACGDGVLDGSEECDLGGRCTLDASTSCFVDADCALADTCGPPVDGTCSVTTTLACSADEDCGVDPVTLLPLETCIATTCDSNCNSYVCGNDVVQPLNGEECDDGILNGTAGSDCNVTCDDTVCPNGVLGVNVNGEECDDGNTIEDDGCTSLCELDPDLDGVVGAADPCQAVSAGQEGRWIGRNYDDSVQKMTFRGDFQPASNKVCDDNWASPCTVDSDCGAANCRVHDISQSGFTVQIYSDSKGGPLYEICVPGEADMAVSNQGGEYQFKSLSPICSDQKDGYRRKDRPAQVDVIYRNRSGKVPLDTDTTEGTCLGDANGLIKAKLSYRVNKDDWKWQVVMKNDPLLAPLTGDPDADNQFSVQGNLFARFIMGSGNCTAPSSQGVAGQCADVKYDDTDGGFIPNSGSGERCKVQRIGGTERTINCRN